MVPAFSRARSISVCVDRTLQAVQWQGATDLSAVMDKPVKLRFHLKNGSLYSFWISPEQSGASHGYVAAGGPGFDGPTDSVGLGAAAVSTDGL